MAGTRLWWDRPVATVGEILREARAGARLSQLELSLRLGVSARHLGFVELGRARPGRALLVRWLSHLEVPLAVRNQALVAAGYAPLYDDAPLDDDHLREATAALGALVESHAPFPALLVDAGWNLLAGNAGLRRVLDLLGVDAPVPSLRDGAPDGPPLAMTDLLITHGLADTIVNLEEVAAPMLAQLRGEAIGSPAVAPLVAALEELAAGRPAATSVPPTLVTRYRARTGELAFLSMITTFGVPLHVTLASLRVELLFPAYDATRAALATGG